MIICPPSLAFLYHSGGARTCFLRGMERHAAQPLTVARSIQLPSSHSSQERKADYRVDNGFVAPSIVGDDESCISLLIGWRERLKGPHWMGRFAHPRRHYNLTYFRDGHRLPILRWYFYFVKHFWVYLDILSL